MKFLSDLYQIRVVNFFVAFMCPRLIEIKVNVASK